MGGSPTVGYELSSRCAQKLLPTSIYVRPQIFILIYESTTKKTFILYPTHVSKFTFPPTTFLVLGFRQYKIIQNPLSFSFCSQLLSMSPSEEKKGKNRPQPSAKISSGKKKNKTGKKQEIPEHHLGEEAQINGNLKRKVDKKKKKTNNEENNDVSREMQPKNTSRKNRTVVTDRRFESLHYDPKFQSVPKQQSKVTIDERFESMFTDKTFASSSAPVDKRGKSRKGKSPNPLLNYYINQNDPLKPGKSGRLNEFDATLLGDEEDDEDGMSSGSSTSTSSDEEDYDEVCFYDYFFN